MTVVGPRVGVLLLALLLSACASRSAEPVTAADAIRLHERCPAGSFIGAMTATCPEVVK